MPFRRSEDVFINLLRSTYHGARHGAGIEITSLLPSRRLSSLAARGTTLNPSIGKQVARNRIAKLPQARKQAFATTRSKPGKTREIAVLGGGVTGLAAAHYLARHAKNAHITLYEASDRLGGWVEGKLFRVGNGRHDKILFQRGPRMLQSGRASLKYDDLVFYDMLINLGMADDKSIFRNPLGSRYLYYPDHLVKVPEKARDLQDIMLLIDSFLTEPLWNGATWSALHALRNDTDIDYQDSNYQNRLSEDESVGHYLGRILGDDRLVNNVVSAIMHGIYGGDIYKISVKHSIFSSFWRHRRLPPTHLGTSAIWVDIKDVLLSRDMLETPNRALICLLCERAIKSSTIAYEDGLLTFVDGLIKDLKAKNVTIKLNSRVASLAHEDNKVSVTVAGERGETKQYDQVISALFSKHLSEIVEPKGSLPALADTHAVTIMVVNIWFPNPNLLAQNHGLGYLIPTTTPENHEWVLGVLFDSDFNFRDEHAGTKLTVMMGGHYWDDMDYLPNEGIAKEIAIDAVRRHLNISPDEKAFASAHLCRDCIPQHFVGHRSRMRSAHYELLAAFQGRLSVAGPSYTNVGVMPALRAGFDAAMRVAKGHGPPWFASADEYERDFPGVKIPDHVGVTGLESFTESDYANICYLQKDNMVGRIWTADWRRFREVVR